MRAHFQWQLRTRALGLGRRTRIMGIVNVTPDSFSDGGAHVSTPAAVEHGLRLLDEGADLLDIGGESTRPGSSAATSSAIAGEEEQRRVLPVIRGILDRRPDAILSVDTYRAETARAAAEAGAEIVNDVSGLLWDDGMAATVAALGCGVVLMHTRGLPSEWGGLPALPHDQVLPAVVEGLQACLQRANAAGITLERTVLDPGFGFGKVGEENRTLLAKFAELSQLRRPLLAGLSRKGFLSPASAASARDPQTHAANTIAIANGAHIVRVHDVAGARLAADVADAAQRASA